MENFLIFFIEVGRKCEGLVIRPHGKLAIAAAQEA